MNKIIKLVVNLIEFLGWLRIVASPLAVGIIAGFIIYLSKPNTIGLILGISTAVVGLIIGIIWATNIWKKQGTINFISRIIATPELDKKEERKD